MSIQPDLDHLTLMVIESVEVMECCPIHKKEMKKCLKGLDGRIRSWVCTKCPSDNNEWYPTPRGLRSRNDIIEKRVVTYNRDDEK